MSQPTTIDLCICTFRRLHVVSTLASLAMLEKPFDTTFRIIIADNDDEPSAQVMVANAAEEYGLAMRYIHAPARNISIARNACLDAANADFIAFIDDDEIVTPQWLVALTQHQQKTNAEIVLGPVQAVYAANAPKWLIEGDFHSTRPVWVRNRIITGYCGNVLIQHTAPSLAALRFREDLGISGGEDTDFFSRAHRAGATIEYAANAVIYEGVPPERANFAWLRRRRLRYGQTHAMDRIQAGHSRARIALLGGIKAALCFAMVILSPRKTRAWVLRGMLHVGVMQHVVRKSIAR